MKRDNNIWWGRSAWKQIMHREKIPDKRCAVFLQASLRLFLLPTPAAGLAFSINRGHAPSALAGAQGPSRMEPIQQPASRCSPKQSFRLQPAAEKGREQEREIGI